MSGGRPERSRWLSRALLGTLAAGGLLCLLAGIREPPFIFDEGYALYGAERILDGEVPYRDFSLVYAPAQFYVVAGIFKLFGPSILVVRVYDTLVRLMVVALVYRIAARRSTPVIALASGLVAALALGSMGFYGYAMYPALALALAGVLCLMRFFESSRTRDLVLAGLAIGGATLFRHDVGLYAVASAVPVLATLAWRRSAPSREARRHALWHTLGTFLLALAIPVVPVLLALTAAVPGGDLWLDLVKFPASVLNRYRGLPYPPLPAPGMPRALLRFSVLFYLPIVVFSYALIDAVARRRDAAQALVALLGLFFFRQGLNRADEPHMLPATLVVAVLAPVLLYDLARRGRRWVAALAAALLALGGADAYLVGPAREILRKARDQAAPGEFSTLERGRGIRVDADEEQAIRYVQEHTTSADHIFVGNWRHDRISVNDILFYFLADRHSATRYHDLCPGLVTTLPVQREIVSDLERKRVKLVILSTMWEGSTEPNESGRSSGVTLLDEYLRANYTPVTHFGPYVIVKRKS